MMNRVTSATANAVNINIAASKQPIVVEFKRLGTHLVANAVQACGAFTGSDDPDPEALHQLRVALRRLRTLLWIYKPVLPKGSADHWRTRLSEVADKASFARKWDVFLTEILPQGEIEPDNQLSELITRARQERQRSNREASAQLPVADIEALLESCVGNLTQDTSATWRRLRWNQKKLARRRLRKAKAQLAKRCRRSTKKDLTTMHGARIATKRMRYIAEFFGPVLKRRARKRIKALTELQDDLGRLNDRAEAVSQIGALVVEREPNPAEVSLKSRLEQEISDQSRRLNRRLHRIGKTNGRRLR